MRLLPVPRLRALALIAALVVGLSACVTPISIPETETRVACESFRIITFSRQSDTEETITQVREHNAAYEALCGAQPGVSVPPR